MMKQNLTNIFFTFLACSFTFCFHTAFFLLFFFVFSFCFSNLFALFALFAFHPFHFRFIFSPISLALKRLFKLIFALHLTTFLILYLFLMSFSHFFHAFTSVSFNFLTPILFLKFISITSKHHADKCPCGDFILRRVLWPWVATPQHHCRDFHTGFVLRPLKCAFSCLALMSKLE